MTRSSDSNCLKLFSIASNCDNGQAEEKANQTHPSNSLRGRRQEGVEGRGPIDYGTATTCHNLPELTTTCCGEMW